MGVSAGSDNKTGSWNTFIGRNSGHYNYEGKGNIAIGTGAGPTNSNHSINMRLYIDVDTLSDGGNDNPLIYGEFDNRLVRINGEFEATGGVANGSSIELKENLIEIDRENILDKVEAMPMQSWNYKNQPTVMHIGATAEDFYASFGYGTSDKVINTIDADGVALSAIQALIKENKKLKETNEKLWEAIKNIETRLMQREED